MNPLVHDAEYTMVVIRIPHDVYSCGVNGVYCVNTRNEVDALYPRIVNIVQPVRVDGVMKS